MALQIHKTLSIKDGPFGIRNLDLIILEKVESLIQIERRLPIKVFSVNYQEVKSTKVGYRMFYIKEALNQKDK